MNSPRRKIKLEWMIIAGFLCMAIVGMMLLIYAMGRETN